MGIQLAWKREGAWNEKRLTREEVEREIDHRLMSPSSIFIVLGHSVLCIILDAMRHCSIITGFAESPGAGSGPIGENLVVHKRYLRYLWWTKKEYTSRLDATAKQKANWSNDSNISGCKKKSSKYYSLYFVHVHLPPTLTLLGI